MTETTNLLAVGPGNAWGNPVVAGTRIPTFRIAELWDAGVDPLEVYPELTPEAMDAALAFEHGTLTRTGT